MKLKKVAALGAAVAVVLTGVVSAPAFADPVSNSYVAVGSDTLQDSMNALTNGTRLTGSFVRVLTPGGVTVGNFDAFGSATIQTKPSGPTYVRPAGSGNGRNALIASIKGLTDPNAKWNNVPIGGQIDIARSSSGPGTNANSAGKLLYVPYARDAVGYAYKGGDASWANLTAAQLKQIYDGTLTSVGGAAIKPRLPQSGSGTRNFFLNALGYSGSTPASPAGVTGDQTVGENDASVLADGEIIPFSIANWVSQANLASGVNTIPGDNSVKLGTPVQGQAPYSGSGSSLVPTKTVYDDTTFGRDVYLIVEFARVDQSSSSYDAGLAALVDTTDGSSLAGFGLLNNQSGAVKKKFGFLAPSTSTPVRAYASI